MRARAYVCVSPAHAFIHSSAHGPCADWEIICGGRPTAADVCSRLPYFSAVASGVLVALFYGSNGEPFMASLGYRPPPDSTAWYTPFTAVLAQCDAAGFEPKPDPVAPRHA